METVLSLDKLNKNYGPIRAVNSVSLQVERGWVYGLLGPNGSGKTTTLGMILNVIRPTGGVFSWFGQPASTEQLKKIGAILEAPLFYPYLSGEKNLKIVAQIKDVPYERIDEVLKRVGLLERKDSLFRTYSLGMKQRLAIAAALLPNPDVLILDEPTNGLDPQGIAQIRQLIKAIAAEGTTIILASHLLDEVEKVCSHVGILKSGTLLFSGPVEEIPSGSSGGRQILLEADEPDKVILVIKEWGIIKNAKQNGNHFALTTEAEISGKEINQYFFDKGVVLSHLVVRKASLEENFLYLLGRKS